MWHRTAKPACVVQVQSSVKKQISERISERSRVIELQKDTCQKSVEVAKSIPQERSLERMCEQSEVIKETSSQDQICKPWHEHELASRFFERIRARMEQADKERSPSFFVTMGTLCADSFQATDAPVLVRCHCRYGATSLASQK